MLSLPAPVDKEPAPDVEATVAALMERFANDEGLTAPLMDEAAAWLLRYAEERIRHLVASGTPPDALDEALSALRRTLRKAARLAGSESDQMATLRALLEAASQGPSPSSTEPKAKEHDEQDETER